MYQSVAHEPVFIALDIGFQKPDQPDQTDQGIISASTTVEDEAMGEEII
jgi:hypothetical protein